MGLDQDLTRWVEEGIVTVDQADRIRSFESGRSEGSTSRGIEALAYLGATLVLVALFMLGQELWDQFEEWGQFTLAVIIGGVLYTVGWALGRSSEAAVKRAQTFAWALVVPAVALAGAVLFFEILGLDDRDNGVWIALLAFAAALALWWNRRSALQMVALAGSLLATVVLTLTRFSNVPDWAFGLSIFAIGAVWLLLTWGGVLTPVRTSYALGSLGVLFIAFPESNEMPWPLFGLLAALGLVAVSVRLSENVMLGLGVAGLFVYVPMLIFEWFGDSLGAVVALLISGLVLLGIVVGVVRYRAVSS
jgi:hypothetical protein